MRLNLPLVLASSLVLLAACETPSGGTSGNAAATPVAPLGVSFNWDGTSKCFDPASPAFTVSGAPAETAKLKFRMKDLDAPSFNHGGGEVAYSGQQVPRGAFIYKGPCPPSGSHDYRWDVSALDASGNVVARGEAMQPFSQSGR